MRYKDYVVFYGEIGTADSVKAKEFGTEEQSEEVDIKLDWYEGDEEGLKRCFLCYGKCMEKDRLSGRFIYEKALFLY